MRSCAVAVPHYLHLPVRPVGVYAMDRVSHEQNFALPSGGKAEEKTEKSGGEDQKTKTLD